MQHNGTFAVAHRVVDQVFSARYFYLVHHANFVYWSLDLRYHNPPGVTQHDLPTFRVPVIHSRCVAAGVADNV